MGWIELCLTNKEKKEKWEQKRYAKTKLKFTHYERKNWLESFKKGKKTRKKRLHSSIAPSLPRSLASEAHTWQETGVYSVLAGALHRDPLYMWGSSQWPAYLRGLQWGALIPVGLQGPNTHISSHSWLGSWYMILSVLLPRLLLSEPGTQGPSGI